MKQEIWKFPLDPKDAKEGHLGQMLFELEMPQRSEILTIQVQLGIPVVWAMVWVGLPKLKRRIELYNTGEECESMGRKYIGSVRAQRSEVELVLHAFEAP